MEWLAWTKEIQNILKSDLKTPWGCISEAQSCTIVLLVLHHPFLFIVN